MNKYNITTYTSLIKEIILLGQNKRGLVQLIESLEFSESEELLYNNLPLAASFVQLPIVEDGDAYVKIVKLQQAENYVLIVPQKVVEAYNLISEDAEIVAELNREIDLYAEVDGFDEKDPELTKIIKTSYLNLGNRLPAYELTAQAKGTVKDKDKEPEDDTSDLENFDFEDTGYEDFENADADAFDDFLTDAEVENNEEAFNRFTGNKNNFKQLVHKLYINSPELIRENTKIKMHKNLLIVKINNKNIYESLSNIPKLAKSLITEAGELLRKNNDTQLVDSINVNKQRFFIIASAKKNNFWKTTKDTLDIVTSRSTYIKPLQKNIITLGSSNIRVEARKYRPALDMNNQLVFIERRFKDEA